jgi:imidazole glycerol-phosphate synthase subunit HisH
MIAVIKYNAGNIRSVENALNRIGYECIVTDDQDEIKKADKVILPGVGEASTAMEYLKSKNLDTLIKSLKQPVLGICLGLQLMSEYSEEGTPHPNLPPKGRNEGRQTRTFPVELPEVASEVREVVSTICMGIFNTRVKLFPPKELVPQMGWNNLSGMKIPLFKGVSENEDVYFVHSYYAELSKQTAAVCDYILPFSAALQKDNFYATQFHPEKSGKVGEMILKNFLAI